MVEKLILDAAPHTVTDEIGIVAGQPARIVIRGRPVVSPDYYGETACGAALELVSFQEPPREQILAASRMPKQLGVGKLDWDIQSAIAHSARQMRSLKGERRGRFADVVHPRQPLNENLPVV